MVGGVLRGFVCFVLTGILMILCINAVPALAEDVETYYRNGYIFFSQENYERSAEQYRLALEIDPGYHDARYWLGKTLEQQGNIQGALAEWVRVLVDDPSHADTFGKWRYYAPSYARMESGEIDRLYRALIDQTEPFSLTRQEAYERVLPYGFVLLNRAESFRSLYLAARLFRYAGNQISSLFWPSSDLGYRRALDFLINQPPEPTPEIYDFLLDIRSRYSGNESVQERIAGLTEMMFARQAGAEPGQGKEIERLTIQVEADGISIVPGEGGSFSYHAGGPGASFYIDDEGELETDEE